MTDNFPTFANLVSKKLKSMAAKELYVVDVSDEEIWDAYLKAFPAGTNPIFRERTEHDCSCCRNFIKNLGKVVSLNNNGAYTTVWDVKAPGFYNEVAQALASLIRSKPIKNIYRTRFQTYGSQVTHERTDSGTINWNHFYGSVERRHMTNDLGTVNGRHLSMFNTTKRGFLELKTEAIETVMDLINQNALYRGLEHKAKVKNFLRAQKAWDGSDAYIWRTLSPEIAFFRNSVIGSLIVDLSDGKDVEHAVRSFEQKVAPGNYRRTTAIITPRMITNALEKLRSLGLENAVRRRYARLSDVSVNNVLFVDNSVKNQMKGGLEELLQTAVKTPAPKKAQSISAKDFFDKIIPEASGIELYLENRHKGNFMSLTAPEDEDVKPLFNWDNNFAWSYDGDVADSIKERVKAAGGKVDALMRVSLSWDSPDDLDIHCSTPSGQHIYYGMRLGVLDVDANAGHPSPNPVENMAFQTITDGVYKFWVNNYTRRSGGTKGFTLQYEHDGEIRNWSYDKALRSGQNVNCLEITVRNRKVVDVRATTSITAEGSSTRVDEKWGVQTSSYVPVDTIMLSPNYWDGQERGNKHHFFILKNCKNPDSTRGFYNEYLRPELNEHRKVFEILGQKTKCEPVDDQLSGIGFSTTRRETATFKVTKNNSTMLYNVQF